MYETLNSLGLDGGSSGGGSNGGGTGEVDIDFSGGDLGDISISQVFIPITNYNRPGYSMRPRYITIHETANTAPGATAFMHANYVRNATTPTSWHFTVDDSKVIYQHLPTNETGFHAGDGAGDGNRNSIGIELCVNSGGDFSKTRRNAAVLVRKLMRDYQIPIYNVVTHNHWSGKLCPANLLSQFDNFRNQVMDSTLPNSNYKKVSSPFTDIDEWYSPEDVEKGKTVSYSTAYDVKIGPLKGTLTGSIIFGNSNKANWDLSIDKIVEGEFLRDNFNRAINTLYEASLLPYYSSVAEARSELSDLLSENINSNIETRLKGIDAEFNVGSLFFLDVTLMTVEVLNEFSTNVYVKEKIELKDIDWKDYRNKLNLGLVYILILIAAILFRIGWSALRITRFLKNPTLA